MVKDNTRELSTQSTHTLATSALSVLIGLLSSILVARMLGPAGKGALDLVTSSSAFLAFAFSLSIGPGLTDTIAREQALSESTNRGIQVWALIVGLISGATLLIWRGSAVRNGILPAESYFWPIYVAAVAAIATWNSFVRAILIGFGRVLECNRIDLATRFGGVVCIGLLSLSPSLRNAETFATATALVGVLALLVACAMVRHIPRRQDARPWAFFISRATVLHVANTFHLLNRRLDLYFVSATAGISQAGIYSLAGSTAQHVTILSSAFAIPLLSHISATKDRAEALDTTARACRGYFLLAVPTAIFVGSAAPMLIPLVFGRAFSESTVLFLVLLPGVLFGGLTNILSAVFVGLGKPAVNLAVAASAFAVTIAGNTILTTRIGALGAAITASLCHFAATSISLLILKRMSGARLSMIIPGRSDFQNLRTSIIRFKF